MDKSTREIVPDAQDGHVSDNGLDEPKGEQVDPRSVDQHLLEYEETYVPGRGIQRYNNALKHLIPVRRKAKGDTTMPVNSAGLFSFISMSWLSKFMYKSYRKGLKFEELPRVPANDSCNYNVERLELLWTEELSSKGPENASFSRVAWRFCRTRFLASCFVHSCCVACGILSSTILLRKLLEYVESGTASYEEGIKWAFLLTAAEIFRTLFWYWTQALCLTTALRLRSACLTLVYRKIMDVNNNLANENVGEVINIISNDAERIHEMIVRAPWAVDAPISSIFGVVYVVVLLGPMALLGMIAFVFYYPIQYLISRLIGYFQTKKLNISDTRVRLMNEILDSIKLIKMYAWEKHFSKELLGIREAERQVLLNTAYCESLNTALGSSIPAISTVITFLAYVSGGNNLTAAKVFPYASFLDSRIRCALIDFSIGLGSIVSAGISFNRIQNMLRLEDSKCSVVKPILKSQAVAITNGKFTYTNSSNKEEGNSQINGKNENDTSITSGEKSEQEKLNKPADNAENFDVLFDVSFEASKGKLVGICGQVGSGKSSLLLAALGQLQVSEGQVARDGSCAYVSQQAWITNATLRENILFGEKFDCDRYQEAIYASSLIQDIEMMPGGDQTEIGERGVNLSGGQKQRVALARALYADRDIYFLDDPLSAVDSRVGSHIFENLILGALSGKTVLFVTHQIQYLNRCDDIYMMRDGRIIEHGTHDELMKLGNEYALMVAAISTDKEAEDETIPDPSQKIKVLSQGVEDISLSVDNKNGTTNPNPGINGAENNGKSNTVEAVALTTAENIQQGTVTADTYRSYIAAMGGYCYSIFVLLMCLVSDVSSSFSSWWLAIWINNGGGNTTITRNNETIISDNVNDNPDFSYYRNIYAIGIGIMVLITVTYHLIYNRATIKAANKLHNNLFKKTISTPMRFFDTTPIGRIQHLFSRDTDEVDTRLPNALTVFLDIVARLLFVFSVICYVFPVFILPLLILAVIYYFISKIFRVAIENLKRIENKSRAPVMSFITATVQGLNTIHAFGKRNDFTAKYTHLLDENSKHVFVFNTAVLWLSLRIEALSVAVTSIIAFMVIFFQNQVTPALAGLVLSYSVQISIVLPHLMTFLSATAVRFISVERMNHYARTLLGEGSTNQPKLEPPSVWPLAANIEFKNVCMAYGDDAPLILKNVSFTVHGGEKIGIVGRTGSGKTSLTVALFRLVELAEGKIEIDDVDISEISLSQLRTKLSIIPQDPVLFSGTMRSNLDPFGLYTDEEIWKALEKTELKERVQSINGQLDATVGFGGDNMSVGERQLLCLARALLRNSKILILDEATAAVDPETEIAVQNTVQREFSHCTILTIAHRLQTVLSLSRVLVMDDGRVLEFDTPSKLLKDLNSEFSKMMAASKQAENQ